MGAIVVRHDYYKLLLEVLSPSDEAIIWVGLQVKCEEWIKEINLENNNKELKAQLWGTESYGFG